MDAIELLNDEYKLLQDKVDEIGGFRVTIKGWSVTATIGGLVAIASGKGFSPTVSSAAVDVLLCCFWWFERRQVKLSWLFNKRIRRIEGEIDRERRKSEGSVTFSSPNIFRALFGRKKPSELIRHSFGNKTLESARVWVNREIRLASGSDILFYLLLIAASWLPKMLHVKSTEITPAAPIVHIYNDARPPVSEARAEPKSPKAEHPRILRGAHK